MPPQTFTTSKNFWKFGGMGYNGSHVDATKPPSLSSPTRVHDIPKFVWEYPARNDDFQARVLETELA